MTFLFFIVATVGFYAIGNAVWISTCGYLAGRGRGQMTTSKFPLLWVCSLIGGFGGTWILMSGSSFFFAGATVVAAAVAAGLRQAYKTVQPGTWSPPQTGTGATPIDWAKPTERVNSPTPAPYQSPHLPVRGCDRHPQSMQTDDGTCWGCLLDNDSIPQRQP